MIGKPEWFTYRIFGWGIRPKTWQGYLYIILGVGVFLMTYLLPRPYADIGKATIIAVVVADTLHIMTNLKTVHDERENLHQLIIERNVSYTALAAIIGIMLYQTFTGEGKDYPFDPSLAIILGMMVATKAATTLYVKKKL